MQGAAGTSRQYGWHTDAVGAERGGRLAEWTRCATRHSFRTCWHGNSDVMIKSYTSRCYRVTFDLNLVYDFEFAPAQAAAGHHVLLIYRVTRDRRDPQPLRHHGGSPMQFEATSRHRAIALGCDILQSIHGKHPTSIVAC